MVMMLAVASSAVAAEQGATEEQPAPTTTTGPEAASTGAPEPVTGAAEPAPATATTTGDSADTDSNGDDNRGVAIVIFLLGAIGVGLAYFFYDRWRQSYEKLALSALQTSGGLPQTVFNPVEDAQFRGRGETDAPQPVVTGPATVVVDEPNVYRAAVNGGPAASCTWTVKPEDAATVQPTTGADVTVTVSKEGPLTLSAKIGEGEPTLVPLTAVAKTSGGGVPLLGTGFAGFAAAIIAFSLAGGLTALDILGGEAFIAFLGPVVGYFFAQARNTDQSSSAGPA